jgi:hypothetical protein
VLQITSTPGGRCTGCTIDSVREKGVKVVGGGEGVVGAMYMLCHQAGEWRDCVGAVGVRGVGGQASIRYTESVLNILDS